MAGIAEQPTFCRGFAESALIHDNHAVAHLSYNREIVGNIVMPEGDVCPCAELFRAYVLRMLRKKGLIDHGFIEMIMKWNHVSGFSVHNQVRVKAGDDKGVENLAQYIIRNTFSLAKLTYLKDSETVIYRSKMSHGKNKKNFQVFTPLDFIAAITQHIPEKSLQLVRW